MTIHLMNDLAIYFTTSLCVVYITLIAVFFIRSFSQISASKWTASICSVIVPARNEATNIDACLRALSAQTYPANHLKLSL